MSNNTHPERVRYEQYCIQCDAPAVKRCKLCGLPLCVVCAKAGNNICSSCAEESGETNNYEHRRGIDK